MQDEYFDEMHELSMVGGMGSINTLREYNEKLKGKKKIWKRPIGFICDIDKLEVSN